MRSPGPEAVAGGALPAPPPPGWVQLFDGFFPALPPGDYTIAGSQTVPGPSGPQPYATSQAFTIQAPEFFIDPTGVEAAHPPAGGADRFEQDLPFVVLADPTLPWERALTPNQPAASEENPLPWVALLVFAEPEVRMPAGGTDPTTSMTVAQLLAPDPDVLKPALPAGWVGPALLASQCRTITVSGAAFTAAVPHVDELPLLAHVRAVNSASEGQQLRSVVLANRLPVSGERAVRWHAHLVSLEGFEPYLRAGATLPRRPGSDTPQDVMLASLHGWTFTSLPETGFSFAQLAAGLVASESGSGCPGLALPADPKTLPDPVARRLADGYAPLALHAISGEQSFAWYRGPLIPVVPQALPALGDGTLAVADAPSADALAIYLAQQGVFDLSYAAAWNAGRNLALADAAFAQAVHALRLGARRAATTLAQRLALPHLAGQSDPAALLARDAGRARFAALMEQGLGERWHGALGAAREDGPALDAGSARPRRRARPMVTREQLLAHPGAPAALSAEVAEQAAPVARWLRRARLLEDLPFAHLVPDPRMLPAESIRFFYVDPHWLDAFTAGALSLAVHSSTDTDLQAALQRLLVPAPEQVTGLLIRSQMVADTPGLAIEATMDGAPLTLLRDDVLAPGVRLVLFQGVPDAVTLAQPAHGLIFGVEDGGVVAPRAVTGAPIGAQLFGTGPLPVPTRSVAPGALGGVVDVATLAARAAVATGVAPYGTDAVVAWNGSALATRHVDANTLTATVPATLLAGVGTAAVTVVGGGVASAPVSFAVQPAFAIAQLSPSTVIAGSGAFALTVEGQGFGNDAAVRWDGQQLATQVVSRTMLLAQVPAASIASPGSASVSVTSGTGTTPAVTLPIRSGQAEIDAIAPAAVGAGAPGFTLAVTGSGFVPGATVQWNGTALVTTVVDASRVTAAVPAALVAASGSVGVTVTIPAGEVSNEASLTIAPPGTPVIDAVSPAVAIAGPGAFKLTIDGANFSAGATVGWNGTSLATTVHDAGQLSAMAPANVAAGAVALTVTAGSAMSAPWSFTVLPTARPTVGLLVPAQAAAGSGDLELTVHGGFGAGDLALQMVKAPERLTFAPPSHAEEVR